MTDRLPTPSASSLPPQRMPALSASLPSRSAPPREVPNWPVVPRRNRRDAWALRRWLLVVGAVTLLFSILAVLAGSLAVTRLDTARSFVIDEIQPAQRAADDLSAAMLNQETGVRGYLLTGRDEFLDPYLEGVEQERRATEELRSLADGAGLTDITAEVDEVLDSARAWREEFAEPTVAALRSAAPIAGSIDVTLGKAEFDQVRQGLAELETSLAVTLADSVQRLRDAGDFLRLVFVTIAVGLAALLITVGAWLRRAVTAPLSRLASEVRLVVAGDAHREVRVGGPREVVELADDIDSMRRHILDEVDALALAHRRLDEQARDLERSNRDLEQFAYVASHDLQEPLRKVSSFCQLLQRRYAGQMDERADSYIGFAVDGARRMQQLINDLLAFSRVGRLTTGFGEVDLGTVVDGALAQLSTVTEETDAAITVGDLPRVRGEAGLLVQLLANLVGNALKFRRPGITPEVTVDAAPHQDGWEIRVADNGIGVEPEYTDKVFVIFQRLHARDDYPGTGIGLAMAKKIVEYHGGRIWIDPDRTDGATVRFTLPAAAAGDDGRTTAYAEQTEEPAS